jgi:phosphoribosylaminoimidazole-succinocarboxamide synthase
MTTPTTTESAAGVQETGIPGLERIAQGKVRDIYAAGDDRLLIVSTDRVSAFDSVLPTPIPDRGKVLTRLSAFWFGQTQHLVPNHLLSVDLADFPEPARAHGDVLAGRSMLVRRARRIDVECVARGYLAGSAWSEYRRHGAACGVTLPAGLAESDQLPEPIFTPATKAASGHDENISYGRLVEIAGAALAEQLRRATLAVYRFAAQLAREQGIIIADTKLEFGLLPAGQGIEGEVLRNAQDGAEGVLIVIDELLTPDSSRFWDAASYRPGAAPASFDKQYLRDWLERSGWNKEPPAPELPAEVVQQTRARYVDALRRLTGQGL